MSDFDGDYYTLFCPSVSSEMLGKFTCRADNSAGVATSSSEVAKAMGMAIEKCSLPQFPRKLLGKTVHEGDCVHLECHVTGLPPPKITWSKDGQVLHGGNKTCLQCKENSDSSLYLCCTLKDVQRCNSGEYKVVAENAAGQVSTSARLKVEDRILLPTIIEEHLEHRVLPHETCTFSVTVSGGPDLDIKWFRDNELMASKDRFKIKNEVMNSGQNIRCNLLIKDVQLDDSGPYVFHASNEVGEVVKVAMLKVIDPISSVFTINLSSSSEHCITSKAHCVCTIPRNPPPQSICTVIPTPVKTGWDDVDHSLVIKKSSISDSGKTQVNESNEFGKVYSVTLTVLPTIKTGLQPILLKFTKPIIISCLRDNKVKLNSICRFVLSARGRPPPNIQWFHNEVLLAASDRILMRVRPDDEYSLFISNISLEDSGVYRARLWNEFGEESTSAQLCIEGPPGKCMDPMIDTLPKNCNLQEGSECTFFIKVYGAPFVQVNWYKDGVLLDKSNPRYSFLSDNNFGVYHLTIDKVVISDSGLYNFEVINKVGRKMASSRLTVTAQETEIVSTRFLKNDHTDGEVVMELLCVRGPKGEIGEEQGGVKRRWIIKKAYFATDHSGQLVMQKWLVHSFSDYVFGKDKEESVTDEGSAELIFEKQVVEITAIMKESHLNVLWLKDGQVLMSTEPDEDPKYEVRKWLNHSVHGITINYVSDEDAGVYTFKVLKSSL